MERIKNFDDLNKKLDLLEQNTNETKCKVDELFESKLNSLDPINKYFDLFKDSFARLLNATTERSKGCAAVAINSKTEVSQLIISINHKYTKKEFEKRKQKINDEILKCSNDKNMEDFKKLKNKDEESFHNKSSRMAKNLVNFINQVHLENTIELGIPLPHTQFENIFNFLEYHVKRLKSIIGSNKSLEDLEKKMIEDLTEEKYLAHEPIKEFLASIDFQSLLKDKSLKQTLRFLRSIGSIFVTYLDILMIYFSEYDLKTLSEDKIECIDMYLEDKAISAKSKKCFHSDVKMALCCQFLERGHYVGISRLCCPLCSHLYACLGLRSRGFLTTFETNLPTWALPASVDEAYQLKSRYDVDLDQLVRCFDEWIDNIETQLSNPTSTSLNDVNRCQKARNTQVSVADKCFNFALQCQSGADDFEEIKEHIRAENLQSFHENLCDAFKKHLDIRFAIEKFEKLVFKDEVEQLLNSSPANNLYIPTLNLNDTPLHLMLKSKKTLIVEIYDTCHQQKQILNECKNSVVLNRSLKDIKTQLGGSFKEKLFNHYCKLPIDTNGDFNKEQLDKDIEKKLPDALAFFEGELRQVAKNFESENDNPQSDIA